MSNRTGRVMTRHTRTMPTRHKEDSADRGLNETGQSVARAGYTVLDRDTPGDPYNRGRRGLSEPVAGDFDDEGTRFGYLT